MSVVVTGGTSGVGLAAALKMAADGVKVVLTYARDTHAAEEARRLVTKQGAAVDLIRADLGDPAGVEEFGVRVRAAGDRVDHLIHAAAAGKPGDLLELSSDELDRAVRLNGTSIVHVVREVEGLLAPGSSVLFVTSAGAVRAIPQYGTLGAPKALAEHLVRYLARELAPKGVRINCISPGPVDTKARREMFPDTWEERLQAQVEANPSGRGVSLEEIAEIVALLAHDAFRMMQGQVITVDGGLTL